LNELLGFLGVTIAVLIALALLSYSPHDPSFNVSTDSPDLHAARNWIGPVGAYGADLFFQALVTPLFSCRWGFFCSDIGGFGANRWTRRPSKLAGYSMLVLMVPTLLTFWRMPMCAARFARRAARHWSQRGCSGFQYVEQIRRSGIFFFRLFYDKFRSLKLMNGCAGREQIERH